MKDNTALKVQIIEALSILKSELKLLMDKGRYLDRRKHMISDVEYDRRVKETCLQLSNMVIDNCVGSAVINKKKTLQWKWRALRKRVVTELNKEYSSPAQSEGENEQPAKGHNTTGSEKKG